MDQLSPQDFVGLSPAAVAELAARVLAHVGEQSRQIGSQAQAIEFRDAKIASIIPTAGLVAYTTVSRFVDHIPYYRQEQINARSGVHTPRSTLAS